MLQKRHCASHVDGETGDRGHVVDNVSIVLITLNHTVIVLASRTSG